MNEEEKKAIYMLETFIINHKFYNIKQSDGLEDNIKIALNLIEKQQKEIEGLQTKVDTGIEIIKELKEIEKSHQEENGKLRVEFEKVYEDNLTLAKELDKQEKMIDKIIKHICDIIDNDDNASLLPFYNSDDNIEEKVRQYFEKKAEESE